MRYGAALALLLVACGNDARPLTRVDVAVRNLTRADVVVTPWPGADPVTVPARGVVGVQASAPPQPWTFVVADASGRELHTTELRLLDTHSVLVTGTATLPDTVTDGSDLKETP